MNMAMNNQDRIIFVSGCFNILHPGHLRLLRFAKELGGKLIVGVLSDRVANGSAHIPEHLRLEGVKSNTWVSETFLVDKPIKDVILELKPQIIVKGKEYLNKYNIELEVLNTYGGKLIFSSGEAIFSSLDLIRKNVAYVNKQFKKHSDEYLDRHNIDKKSLENIIDKFCKLKVCVIGDLIVDEYISCDPIGMSQEDPTIVVTPIDNRKFIGGAGIVAAHASSLGATVDIFSVAGADINYDWVKNSLSELKITSYILIDESRPTTLKQRYKVANKSLLKVSHLHQEPISKELQSSIFNLFKKNLESYDLLIFSDFNYGCLPQELVKSISKICKSSNLIMVADSQSSSQVGDIGRFSDMNILFTTEREARISLKNREDGLVVLAESLRQAANAENIFLKLGAEGLLLQIKTHNLDVETDKLPAFNPNPIDVAGAGDSMLAVSSMALATKASIWHSAYLGSLAAAIQVGRQGNVPMELFELKNLINFIDYKNI